ncbi:MAG: hypothetical protein KF861_07515 [Planctomycetaceae bacterium]|nr:hypothetical protein [Planctomycetaceae bacterium]
MTSQVVEILVNLATPEHIDVGCGVSEGSHALTREAGEHAGNPEEMPIRLRL